MKTNLKINNITKIYPGCIANEDISLEFESGKIYALLGENGAGKSTLVKILSGVVKPDQGNIFINNNLVVLKSLPSRIALAVDMKLKEVMELCDEVAVMRKGKLVSMSKIKEEKIESLANKMVGQNLKTVKKK